MQITPNEKCARTCCFTWNIWRTPLFDRPSSAEKVCQWYQFTAKFDIQNENRKNNLAYGKIIPYPPPPPHTHANYIDFSSLLANSNPMKQQCLYCIINNGALKIINNYKCMFIYLRTVVVEFIFGMFYQIFQAWS